MDPAIWTASGIVNARRASREVGFLQERGMEHLEGHVAVQGRVIGLVDRGHPALTELLNDPVRTNVLADRERHRHLPGWSGPLYVRLGKAGNEREGAVGE